MSAWLIAFGYGLVCALAGGCAGFYTRGLWRRER